MTYYYVADENTDHQIQIPKSRVLSYTVGPLVKYFLYTWPRWVTSSAIITPKKVPISQQDEVNLNDVNDSFRFGYNLIWATIKGRCRGAVVSAPGYECRAGALLPHDSSIRS